MTTIPSILLEDVPCHDMQEMQVLLCFIWSRKVQPPEQIKQMLILKYR